MAEVAASGVYMVPFAKLADTLAAATSVQTRFGVSDATAALQRIVWPVLESEHEIREYLPGIVLSVGDKFDLEQVAGGSQNFLRPANSGSSILMTLADKAAFPDDLRCSYRDFGNWVGSVIADLIDIAGQSDQLSIVGIRQDLPIVACSKEEQDSFGLYFMASFWIDWN
jgi:hypothetical protein